MTTGEHLVSVSTLTTGTALEHLQNIALVKYLTITNRELVVSKEKQGILVETAPAQLLITKDRKTLFLSDEDQDIKVK